MYYLLLLFLGVLLLTSTYYAYQQLVPSCPNLLIQEGTTLQLINTRNPTSTPIVFSSMDEYHTFLQWQQQQGIHCPVLYLQKTYDTQGKAVYKHRPSTTSPQYGLPPSKLAPIGIASQTQPTVSEDGHTLLIDATRNDPPYNANSYPGIDQSSLYQGRITPIDQVNNSPLELADPMSDNWKGADYTQQQIEAGVYAGNNVQIYIP